MAGDAEPNALEGAQAWQLALQTAKKRRLRWTQLPLKDLASKHRATPDEIADIAVRLHKRGRLFVDPLVPRYIEQLIRNRCTGSSHILMAMLRHSRLSDPATVADYNTGDEASSIPPFEEQIFTLLRNMLAGMKLSASSWKAHGLVLALTRWLHVSRKANEQDVSKRIDSGAMSGADGPAASTFDALGLLAIAVFGHRSFRDIEKQPWWKNRRATVVEEMEQYDLHVLQWTQSQYAGHLQALAKSRPFLETDDKGLPIFTDEQVLGSVSDIPVVNSRAGLFIWLNACLCARPLTDDATMRNYMLVRCNDNAQNAAVDLLIASFDVLTNALLRHESKENVRFIRSFLCNKVPLLLHSLLGFNGPSAVESCIQMSFTAITMDPLTPLSTGATDVRDVLKKTRLEFVLACSLHSLISERSVSNLVNEQSVTIPKSTKYTKDGLMTQTSNNTGRLDTLIQELDSMTGNAGAISGCIIDTVNSLCANRDTTELKNVCTSLTKKFPNLDVIMLFTQPANLLLPLCNILNDWVHDQDSSEFQPPYEEFACILLFLLAAIHRYDLQAADLGLTQDNNFIMKMLQRVPQSSQISDLTEEQSKQLAKWIEGLYATDEQGETTGIGDEVMSQCPPQAFYLLVPVLFDQSVLACKSNALSINTILGGLEFLLEPFLLPSLVGGISWLVKHSWEDHNDADMLLQILEKLLKPSGSSQEMQAMHKCILAIVATPLESSLQELIRRKPEKKSQANGLIELLKPYLHQQRTIVISRAELDAFAANGLLTQAVGNTVRDLALWAANGGSDAPPRYATHLVHCALQVCGSPSVLQAIVQEVRDQTTIGNGSIALDVSTALVCAPDPASYITLMNVTGALPAQPRISLRDAIRLTTSNIRQLLDMPVADAEALVRLARKVEAQSAVSQIALVNLPVVAEDQNMADQVMQDLGLGNNDGTVAADNSLLSESGLGQDVNTDFGSTDFASAANPSIDLGSSFNQDASNLMQLDNSGDIFGDLNMDFGQSAQQSGQGGTGDGNDQQNAEEDIFAGLDMGDLGQDFDFS
ncbi:hypothetical protein Q7P37_008988 [Cladosporium fusiforme]